MVCIFILAATGSYAEDAYLSDDSAENYSQQENLRDYRYTEDGDIVIPPGMELRKVGKINILLPEGTKISKVGNRIITEGANEYMARRFLEIEARFEAIKKEQDALRKIIEDLKGTIGKE